MNDFNNSNCANYRYILITFTKTISVDITWGDLDYTYSEGTWNSSEHKYNEGTWSVENDGDKITVTNNSNVDINADIKYVPIATYLHITGSIIKNKTPQEVISVPQTVENGKCLDAYLVLNGSLQQVSSPVTIGNVTVTITE